jgi:anti-anti-sigma factor
MIMLTVNVHSGLSVVTLLCHGRIVLGLEAETLRCIVTARPEYRVIVDLQDVYRLDACGLGLLVELHCWAQQRAGELRITNPTSQVRRLFALTNLESVLEIGPACERELDAAGQRAMTA